MWQNLQIWRYLKVFDALVARQLPDLAKHFADINLTSDLYMIDW